MHTPPRIVPHELVHTEAEASVETREIDILKYGDDRDQTGYTRTHPAPKLIDPDQDGE